MDAYTTKQGWIEVLCGCMFSGKSEELIERLKRAKIARRKVQIFNSSLDTRYGKAQIISHAKTSMKSAPVRNAKEILKKVKPDTQVVGIDEANLFDATLPEVCEQLARRGVRVIVAGVDLDYTGKPFEVVAQLMVRAEFVTKKLAVCTKCGSPASRSKRIIKNKSRVLVGAAGVYEARCRKCFED